MRKSALLVSPYSYNALPATLQTFSIPPVAEKTLSVKNNIRLILYFLLIVYLSSQKNRKGNYENCIISLKLFLKF
jgi:hypothetical protein